MIATSKTGMGSLFPYKKIRKYQDILLKTALSIGKGGGCAVVHAPTGLGKTAASLAPMLSAAQEQGLIIFFLTSRHTQHKIAIETLKDIQKEHDIIIPAADIIGKKHMCAVPHVLNMPSRDFAEYCKSSREDQVCEFYTNCKKKKPLVKKAVKHLKSIAPTTAEELISYCKEEKLCPYEITTILAKDAQLIIADYNYIFNSQIQQTFLNKIEKSLEDTILIIDEAHNVPQRIRNMLTDNLTNITILRAIKEAKKFGHNDLIPELAMIQDALNELSKNLKSGDEKLISQKEFIKLIGTESEYETIALQAETIGDLILQDHKSSYLGAVARFLFHWKGPDTGYTRIITCKQGYRELITTLSYKCLDPSIISKGIIETAHASLFMSGTLAPTEIYKDILGCPNDCTELSLQSPFKKENRLEIIIPKTTTKYSERSKEQFENIGKITADLTNAIPGNSAIFFPSYKLRDDIYDYFKNHSKKTCFIEHPSFTKEEKEEILEKFKSHQKYGAVLLAVISANYSEGIDLPGDLLKGVIIVGIPLQQPDLETKELIRYYDQKFSKGWEYAYVFPAFQKCFQGAGRCIRTETDRGVIIYLDFRYNWPNYKRYFSSDHNITISADPISEITSFFSSKTGS